MKLKVSALVLATLVSSPALAGDAGTSYAGLQYAQASYEETVYGYDIEGDPSVLVGRLGHYLTDNFSFEGRVGLGLSDDEVTVNGYDTDVTVEVDHLFGAYAVGHLPVTDVVSIYALAGFTQGEATAKADGMSATDDDSGFSYGVGGEVNFFSRQFSGTLEYMSYLDKSSYEVSAISAGVNYQF
ncbi:outer membrane insertion C-terminal signal [Modicisalibacter ilicicola DSM 19980]|uniref:Outer membrane insertion C-terminal signal n=1 Tax=Modicisalibacter ilicicola DSM 19980 TaxID=1121942 RepID=A0A1M5E1I0_9GAMM|nr:porin family protein [Halomonas ilicicola]SHF73093.1 outer membrane insertion C-terminal signal [Halomonas ilicicola DSM 19980]